MSVKNHYEQIISVCEKDIEKLKKAKYFKQRAYKKRIELERSINFWKEKMKQEEKKNG